jgi:hypothetical protein
MTELKNNAYEMAKIVIAVHPSEKGSKGRIDEDMMFNLHFESYYKYLNILEGGEF